MPVQDLLRPITTRAAWRGDRLIGSDEWIYRLSDEQVAELEELGRRFVEQSPDLRSVQAEDYPLIATADAAAEWRETVDFGRGFVLVRGLRTHLYSDARMLAEEIGGTTMFWRGLWLAISLAVIFASLRYGLGGHSNISFKRR